jgi:hypothetical protein
VDAMPTFCPVPTCNMTCPNHSECTVAHDRTVVSMFTPERPLDGTQRTCLMVDGSKPLRSDGHGIPRNCAVRFQLNAGTKAQTRKGPDNIWTKALPHAHPSGFVV